MHKHTTPVRAFGMAGLLGLALGWCIAPAAAADPPTWEPMLARSFKADAKDVRVSSLVVNRNVGCVFLLVEGKGVYCSPAGANSFKPVDETWEEVRALKTKDAKHLFVLTGGGIKESRDGGTTWSKPIPPPKGFVITPETWLEYDARHDVLYLMKAGSDLYKLARGNYKLARGK
jgi:hypothetical protein